MLGIASGCRPRNTCTARKCRCDGIVLLTILLRRNALFNQPKSQALFDLVAYASGAREAVGLIEFCRIIKRPMVMSPHIEEDHGTILLGIRTHGNDMRE